MKTVVEEIYLLLIANQVNMLSQALSKFMPYHNLAILRLVLFPLHNSL